ncbi:MAG: hypothetical protein KGJ06_04990 [Pseudomonadota bacterium]|nr:hypothetical protein [Pseudomonadota bacterium]
MRRISLLALALCLVAGSALAQQRMRDLSMSPEESMQEPDVTHDGIGQPAPLNYVNGSDGSNLPSGPDAMPGEGFMERFCDPGFRPLLADNAQLAGMESCVEERRRAACDTFSKLPGDARRVLDATIACRYSAEDDQGQEDNADCSDGDRLRLLEKYWRNAAVSHALVFLPDEALDNGDCVRRRQ